MGAEKQQSVWLCILPMQKSYAVPIWFNLSIISDLEAKKIMINVKEGKSKYEIMLVFLMLYINGFCLLYPDLFIN